MKMEETLTRKKLQNMDRFGEGRYVEALAFSKRLSEKHKGLIASTLVRRSSEKDIDVLFVIDDLNRVVLNNQAEDVRLSAVEMAYTENLPMKFDAVLASVFWESFKSRDKSALEIVRGSLIVQDNGFMMPLQDLLVTGKIRPTKESVLIYFVKSEQSMRSANKHVSSAILDLYWAVVDSAHSAVMVAGITPPSPKDLGEVLRKELIARNLLHKRCGDIYESFYTIAKRVMHKEVFEISGREYDRYLADADFFLKEISIFVKEHLRGR